jgi:hypothetical protein
MHARIHGTRVLGKERRLPVKLSASGLFLPRLPHVARHGFDEDGGGEKGRWRGRVADRNLACDNFSLMLSVDALEWPERRRGVLRPPSGPSSASKVRRRGRDR